MKFLIKEKANCDLKNLIGSTALDEALNLELSDLIVKKKYKDKKYTFNLFINVIWNWNFLRFLLFKWKIYYFTYNYNFLKGNFSKKYKTRSWRFWIR